MGSLLEEFQSSEPKTELPTSRRIVYSLLNDLKERRGLGDEWDHTDDDVKEEIIEEWIERTERKFDKGVYQMNLKEERIEKLEAKVAEYKDFFIRMDNMLKAK